MCPLGPLSWQEGSFKSQKSNPILPMCELLWDEVQTLSVAPKALPSGLGLPKPVPASPLSHFVLATPPPAVPLTLFSDQDTLYFAQMLPPSEFGALALPCVSCAASAGHCPSLSPAVLSVRHVSDSVRQSCLCSLEGLAQ